jgi:hypothetical protein
MRRIFFSSLGVMEMLVGVTLFAFAWQLPGPQEVDDTLGKAQKVSTNASEQVGNLRKQVGNVRKNQPKVESLTLRLQAQLKRVGKQLRDQKFDDKAAVVLGDALGNAANGLDGIGAVLDPKGLGQIGTALKTTAEYLDGKVAPNAEKAAERLEKTTADIRADALRLNALLSAAPLDLKAARATADALAQFDESLGRMIKVLRLKNFEAIQDGFKGLETSLGTGADQVDRVAGYTYPVVRFEGLKPKVEQRSFWPEGRTTADGMRKAARGVTAAGKELTAFHKELPRLRASLVASRKVVTATKEALETALKQEDKVGPLLKSVPEHAARLAAELPQLGGDLAKVLRETAKLREVAVSLRSTQKGIDASVKRWPHLRQELRRSSELLRAMQKQLAATLGPQQRAEYRTTVDQTLQLIDAFVAALPLLTDQLDAHLLKQEQSLENLGTSLDEVSAALPSVAHTTSRLLVTTRLLLALVGGISLLHAIYLLLGARLGAPYSI